MAQKDFRRIPYFFKETKNSQFFITFVAISGFTVLCVLRAVSWNQKKCLYARFKIKKESRKKTKNGDEQ